MSLIPLDEPRGDGTETPEKGGTTATLTRRLVAGTKAILLALPGVSALVGDTAESAPAEPAERDRPRGEKAPAGLPSGPSEGGVDVVSTESGDTLTVEAVDNPDATISSDTWEPVER